MRRMQAKVPLKVQVEIVDLKMNQVQVGVVDFILDWQVVDFILDEEFSGSYLILS